MLKSNNLKCQVEAPPCLHIGGHLVDALPHESDRERKNRGFREDFARISRGDCCEYSSKRIRFHNSSDNHEKTVTNSVILSLHDGQDIFIN